MSSFIIKYCILIFIIIFLNVYPNNIERCYIFNRKCLQIRVKERLVKYSIISNTVLMDAINFHINFILKYDIHHHIYVALDISSYNKIKQYSNNVFYKSLNINESECMDYGSDNYRKIVLSKTNINRVFLSIRVEVVLIDIDIFFFKNPFPYILKYQEDLTISQDGKKIVNTGL